MSKIKLNALSPEEQLDVLARVYIRECTKPVNKWLSGAIRKAGGEYNSQLNMGKTKNMFLCGSIDADDYGYSVGNPKYETNRFSVTGAFYNYLYRSRLINELNNDYRVDRGITRAYSYVKSYGYLPFYTYMKSAYIPAKPSSVVDEATIYGQTSKTAHILDETLSTGSITLEDFSKDQIKVVKTYIKQQMTKEMSRQGFSTHDIESILQDIDRMRTTPYITKGSTVVQKPSKKLEGFLVSAPTPAAEPVKVEVKAETKVETKVEQKPQVNEATGLTVAEELELLRELDESESVIVTSTDAYDREGTPLCRNQKGLYCYPDGSPFRGDTIYDEFGGIYEDLKEGLVYGAKEREMREAEEEQEDEIRIVNGVKYTSKGYMITDGGHVISPEEYPEEDVRDTQLSQEDKFKSYTGTQLEIDLNPKEQ